MKLYTIIVILFVFLFSEHALSQSISQDWIEYETGRLDINRKGMLALSGWAAANLLSGTIGWATAKGPTKYFFQMNTLWNVVNMGLGIAGYLGSVNADPSTMSASDVMKAYNSTQNLFIFNAGMDVAYIAFGAYLIERGKNTSKNKNLLKGYGSSLILQGGFLFTFDVVMFLVQKKFAKVHLYPLLDPEVYGLGLKIGF
jgi:hypothetical protein